MATKMKRKYKFKIKNVKLALLALVVFAIFVSLGSWQLSRAQQKRALLETYAARTQHEPYTGKQLADINDWRFYRTRLEGKFDNDHTFLLDNKTFHGKVGYEVYTPFFANEMTQPILVDRGFIPIGTERSQLPKVPEIRGNVTILGMLNLPPLYMALGTLSDTAAISWPLRIEFIKLPEIAKLLNQQLFPYVLTLDPQDPRAFPMEWQIVNVSPEKHMGYAIQWFALALTLLILFVALNRSKK